VRLLPDDRIEQRPPVLDASAGAKELVPLRVPAETDRRLATLERRSRIREALQLEQRGAHEQQGSDERRHRVPRKPEHERIGPSSERQRLSRLHRDSPEDFLDAEFPFDPAHEIVRTHRHAARGHEHVEGQPVRQCFAMGVLLVGDDRKELDLGSGSRERRGDHRSVRLVDLARSQRVPGGAELAPRRQHGDAWLPSTPDLRDAGRSESTDLDRAEPRAGLDHHCSHAHVSGARADVRARLSRVPDLDRAVVLEGALDRYDRIRSLRHRASGRNPCRSAQWQRPRPGTTCRDPRRDGKRPRRIRRAEREAVHRRARERRQIDRGESGLGEHAVGRLAQLDGFRREAPRPLENPLESRLDREELTHPRKRHGQGLFGVVVAGGFLVGVASVVCVVSVVVVVSVAWWA
jgi:hypothetical protein